MKKILLISVILATISLQAKAADVYECDPLNVSMEMEGKVSDDRTFTGYTFVIDNDAVVVFEGDDKIKRPVLLLRDEESKIDFIGVGTLTTEIFTITKKYKTLQYVKTGYIEGGYTVMGHSKCRYKFVDK